MSLAAKRTAIRDALADVDGVTAYRYPPRAWKAGDAWPQWAGGSEADEQYARAFVEGWRVLIVLPADPIAADEWVDAHLDDVIAALAPTLSITSYVPQSIKGETSEAAVNGLALIGETE